MEVIKSKMNLSKGEKNAQYDYLSKKYQAECAMSPECAEFVDEIMQPISSDTYDTERVEKIKNKQAECKWTDDLTYRIISRNYTKPTDAFCADLNTQTEALQSMLGKQGSNYFKLFKQKNNMIKTINYNLVKINNFKNDIQNEFNVLNEKEKVELNKIVEQTERERLDMLEQFRKAEIDVMDYIKYLADSNRDMENEIRGLIGDIDNKLNKNNKLELDISMNSSNAKPDDLQEIINSNGSVLDNQIYYKRNEFMLTITVLLILFIFSGYMMYQTYLKFLD
jgi:hypothetical protein